MSVADLQSQIAELQAELQDVHNQLGLLTTGQPTTMQFQYHSVILAMNEHFTLVMAVLVLLMQVGFAMLEAGAVRAKNTKNILLKNLLDTCAGSLAFWLLGYQLAYGRTAGGFTGVPDVPVYGTEDMLMDPVRPMWMHQYVYVATAATIVSGGIAERTQPIAYLCHSLTTAAITYPIVAHWLWSTEGWLSVSNPTAFLGGAIDFAGSSVVHITGGVLALVGSKIIGPRNGRYNAITGDPEQMPGQSSVLLVLGCFILWTAWIAFNCGSILNIVATFGSDPGAMARIAMCTTLSASAGGLTVTLIERFTGARAWGIEGPVNGILSGLVSITAGCSVVASWAAVLCGIVGGGIYHVSSRWVLIRLRVDDVLNSFAVHGACGLWGMIATALFASPTLTSGGSPGLFYGGGHLLGAAVVASIVVIAWSALFGFLVFGSLHKLELLRVPAEGELVGADIFKHGGSAYGADATDAPTREYPPPYAAESAIPGLQSEDVEMAPLTQATVGPSGARTAAATHDHGGMDEDGQAGGQHDVSPTASVQSTDGGDSSAVMGGAMVEEASPAAAVSTVEAV